MRHHWAVSALAGAVLLAGAAAPAPASSQAEDPCGDIIHVEVEGERSTLQPSDWDAFDIARAAINEEGARDEGTYRLDLELELCGPVHEPDTVEDHERFYRIAWEAENGCTRGVLIGWEGWTVYPVSGIGVGFPNRRQVFEHCPEVSAGGIVWTSERSSFSLPAEALTLADHTLIVHLRSDGSTGPSSWFEPGTRLAAPRGSTRAAAPTPGAYGCGPPHGPASSCFAVGDGDRVDLPDLVLTDR